ncbi:N-acetylmuramoyl-L-alanine amidase [Acuticoccus sp. MNP-M23]|uniref:N-acetylmuramoyl-L-alanine amidase n=1 Tax=Acuticoccus sp. MNP-M23 TaxID=3072793 RepID=UPI002814ED0B|nr:N-acetylmuramoyl-L-alanine amidase [Acuticoccus sp. MNP-M23]WMS42542.1 N-acetylmuramoyl-L-alanine amidase [Acuticoccus sp. MNP-M23]
MVPNRPVASLASVFLLFAAVLCSVAASPAAADVRASAAAFSANADATRFVLELDGETSHRVFVVDEPARMVIDFDGVAFELEEAVSGAGVVSGWRYGPLGPDTSRIVFDLNQPALLARDFFLPAMAGRPGRLVLDMKRVSQARFAAAARNAVANLNAPLPAVDPSDEIVVVLDPGHGGIDPGAVARDGILEKEIALAFANRLRDHLEEVGGLTVHLTRSDDRFLSLNRRIRIARAYGADLFISIHADAAPQDYVEGATIYTLSERPSDAQAAALAARENLADQVSGAVEPDLQEDVSGILADLMRRETKAFSLTFADNAVGALAPVMKMNSNPHRYARFRVLMAHDMPSVLLELGYLTNEDDARRLKDVTWQDDAAIALRDAVADFFNLPLNGRQVGRADATRTTQ